jgi:ATP-dependent protease ClpP protease subunit
MELELLFKEEKKDVVSEWDKCVPIVAKGKIITAYLMGEIYETEEYNELCYTLENTEAEEVRLVMNNGGGLMHSMLTIRESIRKSNAVVTAVLSGTVASAATMIALACDNIEVAPHTAFMIHSSSGGISGKSHETKAYMDFSDKNTKEIFDNVYKGFLTQEEIDKVLDGKDMWLNKAEVEERFAKAKNG